MFSVVTFFSRDFITTNEEVKIALNIRTLVPSDIAKHLTVCR